MTITLKQLLDAEPGLRKFWATDWDGGFRHIVTRHKMRIDPELQLLQTSRQGLIAKHGKPLGGRIVVSPEDIPAFSAFFTELNDLLSQSIEIEQKAITLTVEQDDALRMSADDAVALEAGGLVIFPNRDAKEE